MVSKPEIEKARPGPRERLSEDEQLGEAVSQDGIRAIALSRLLNLVT